MELEALHLTLPYQEPFVPNASPIIKNLVSFHQHRTVRQESGCCGLKNVCETFFAQDFDQARSTRAQRCKHVLQDNHILLPIVEISEGRKHAQHEGKGVWAHKIPHIFLNPFDLDVRGPGLCPRLIQKVRCSVNSGDREAPFCKGNAASARTAAEVEDGLACGLG